MPCSGCVGFAFRRNLTIRRISSWSESQCSEWLKGHALVAQKVVCYKSLHAAPRNLDLVGRTWLCTKHCTRRYRSMGPLLPGRSQRSAKQPLIYIVLYARGGRHALSVEETELSERTVIKLRQWLDSIMAPATAHVRRRIRLRSRVNSMQCDETFFLSERGADVIA